MKNSALILVGLQKDFMPGGTLNISHGDEVIPTVNKLIHQFRFVVAAKDWHPEKHISFSSQHPEKKPGDTIKINNQLQRLWPEHCIQNTLGAELACDLDTSGIDHILYKGTEHEMDAYSGFFNNDKKKATGLHTLLKFHRIRTIYILGLLTEFDVKHTALDGLQLGYQVNIIVDACRGFNINKDDSEKTYEQLANTKINLIDTNNLNAIPRQLNFEFGV
jgi:nicotinamidase/pyrazinamidase